ncbi:hypothetical protein ORV05_05425 [Amycolatopsis cynarae]|uniref:Uncharacterized protein n=1 Tax=Amycolatopsis cynarae TaxID=2995223 RepID=A0ABY7B4J5_9PSEU|nr:hypothetical protein [Amycolatopsis sp. HUAS 11-8]WAL67230.1 hypothetical protein ORV05_05425 [Amycolatopsis sp. HUAS 11-8]
MSMPDRTPTDTTPPQTGAELVPVARPVPPWPARTAAWMGWHWLELAGVAVPVVLAWLVSPWWLLAAGLVALLWAAHEYRTNHNEKEIRS